MEGGMMFFNRVLATLLIFLLFIPAISNAARNQRTALVIGNSNYKTGPLKNPINDANDMARLLEDLGFRVTQKVNASRRQMEQAIQDLGGKLKDGGIGLFYFAGHGIQVQGFNYLIPVGASIETENDVPYEAVNANRVLGKMKDAGNSLNIVFLDACRNNPFARQFRSQQQGLAPMDAPTGSLVVFATAPGDVAVDGVDEQNGTFTKHLLKQMREPLEIGMMMRKVRAGVQKDTNGRQTPYEMSSLTGCFYFTKENKSAELSLPQNMPVAIETLPEEPVAKEGPTVPEERWKSQIIQRDRHFIKYDNGIVKDTQNGLEWYAGPNKDTDWYDARQFLAGFHLAGGGWRMPTRDELKKLYQKGVGTRNMTPLLEMTGWYVWSCEKKDSESAWFYAFSKGTDYWNKLFSHDCYRVFAVRLP